jgi:glutamate dehydrogenase/leucine dehydrogenase
MEMTWKTSLIGVPFGGGKSGIRFDPSSVSLHDKERIVRSFARSAKRHFGPELYIPAPDMGTNEKDMGHIRDCVSYSEGTSITKGCFVTGKPIVLGGIPGRRAATGKGVVYTIIAACKNLGIKPDKMRVVIQGFGNVGSEAAREFVHHGTKVIAISDVSGGLFNEQGIDIEDLIEYTSQHGHINGFNKKAESISKEEIFNIPCECLVPAASGSQITRQNAITIKTLIVGEGANAPTTPDADDILNDRGIFVIPDILCNAGGVFVSYLEYVQETQHEQMTAEQVEKRLYQRVTNTFETVYEYSKNNGISMRKASMEIALNRVVEGITARGLLP